MPNRSRLPNRRYQETFSFKYNGQEFIASVGFFSDTHQPAELFLNSGMKVASEADINACDAAVSISLALQYGVPFDILRSAMKRNIDGSAQGPLGVALDLIAEGLK